mgnify:CR=1 FL=1|jgi:hypothetical protein
MSRELVSRIFDEFHAENVDDLGLRCVLPIGESGRTQVVLVVFTGTGFWITSPFASVEEMPPKVAFKIGNDSPYGIAEAEGMYHVKHFVFFEEVDERITLLHGYAVAMWADKLEEYSGKDIY